MKTLSIKQPFASLICKGIKTIENRTWKTNFRGKLLIHASSKPMAFPEFSYLPRDFIKDYQKYYGSNSNNIPSHISNYMNWVSELYQFYHMEEEIQFTLPIDKIKEQAKKYGYALPSQAIIGEAELIDIVQNSKEIFAIPNNYHWVLSNPLVYEKPIQNVMGKLNLWEYLP